MLGMNTDPTTTQLTIEFCISPDWFQTIRRLIFTVSIQCGFNERDSGQITMAVDEALANIHTHGYHFDSTGKIVLTIHTHIDPTSRIDIQLDDETNNVDLDSIRSRDLEDIRPGGLGVHLIRTIMDESKWSKLQSGGIRLFLSKTQSRRKQSKETICEKTNE